jgi:hypothetical protein
MARLSVSSHHTFRIKRMVDVAAGIDGIKRAAVVFIQRNSQPDGSVAAVIFIPPSWNGLLEAAF